MEYEGFIFTKQNGVATLVLNRPERMNAINLKMGELFPSICREVNEDDDIKVLIITGAGKAFSSGADVAKQAANLEKRTFANRSAMIGPVGDWGYAISRIRKPMIAAVNGVAVGAGLSIALLCDIRISSDAARYGALWVKRGLIPDVAATYLLPQIIGVPKALELSFLGNLIDAQEALKIGLVSRVVPADQLMPVVSDMAAQIAAGPSVAIEIAKLAITRQFRREIEDQLYFESYGQKVCVATEDHVEGVKSFMEKRPAKYNGR